MAMLCLSGCRQGIMVKGPITDASQLENRVIGVPLGWDVDYVLSRRDDLKLRRYDTVTDTAMALRYAQIDAVACDIATANDMCSKVTGLKISDVPLGSTGIGCMVNINRRDLAEELNEFIADFRQSEEYEEYRYILYHIDEFPSIERVKSTGTGPVLRVAVDEGYFPLCYYDTKPGDYTGVEVNIMTLFANAYNYQLEISGGTYEAIQLQTVAGLVDASIGGVSEVYREDIEAAGRLLMTDTYMDLDMVFVEVADFDHMELHGELDK